MLKVSGAVERIRSDHGFAKESVILRVRTNPEPYETIRCFDCAMMLAHAG